MYKIVCLFLLLFVSEAGFTQADTATYLDNIKTELRKEWPKNRTINLVFHGHSVPSGYFKTPFVNTFDAYPYQLLKELKTIYPNAVINVIITAIGGEHSEAGEKRFQTDVLTHHPDVLFIDYALNDKAIGLERSRRAMQKMLIAAAAARIKVILLTPTPHQQYNLLDTTNAYEAYTNVLYALAKQYHTGLADSYAAFRKKLQQGHTITEYMSQVNHPNKQGHAVVAAELIKWFR